VLTLRDGPPPRSIAVSPRIGIRHAADLPLLPKWTEGWQLGPPDLVATLPEAYSLPAEGKDVYRNFIIPLATTTSRFVRRLDRWV
jgi:hypothetical protein